MWRDLVSVLVDPTGARGIEKIVDAASVLRDREENIVPV